VAGIRRRLVSVGRYALRGVSHPQELFTLDPDVWVWPHPTRLQRAALWQAL